MKTEEIKDPIFLRAVHALDAGLLDELRDLIEQYPWLLRDRLSTPDEKGYFKDPYLIWFVADNPIRNQKLPANIVEMLYFLVDAIKHNAMETYPEQLNYTLVLVSTGRTPRECGVQIVMMDALLEAGAIPGNGIKALAEGNLAAAAHLIDSGGEITLTTALLLGRTIAIDRLFDNADDTAKLTALTAAAFYGKATLIKYLLDKGVDPNGYPPSDSGFHSHATPLHQAVSAVSLEGVQLLTGAGARLDQQDKLFDGTPMDWAVYMRNEGGAEKDKEACDEIIKWLTNAAHHI